MSDVTCSKCGKYFSQERLGSLPNHVKSCRPDGAAASLQSWFSNLGSWAGEKLGEGVYPLIPSDLEDRPSSSIAAMRGRDHPLVSLRRLGVDAKWPTGDFGGLKSQPFRGEIIEIGEGPIRWINFDWGVSLDVPDARLKLHVPEVYIEAGPGIPGWRVPSDYLEHEDEREFSLHVAEYLKRNAGAGMNNSPFTVSSSTGDNPKGGSWLLGWDDWHPEWTPGLWNYLVKIANCLLETPVPAGEQEALKRGHRLVGFLKAPEALTESADSPPSTERACSPQAGTWHRSVGWSDVDGWSGFLGDSFDSVL